MSDIYSPTQDPECRNGCCQAAILRAEITRLNAELQACREERIIECPNCHDKFILHSDDTIDAFIGA